MQKAFSTSFFLALYFNRPHCWFKFCFSFFYITFPPALMRNEPWPIIRGIIIIIPRRCVIFFIGKFFCIWWVALFFFPSPRLPNPLPVVQDKSIFYFIKEIKQSKQAREISQEASLILTGRRYREYILLIIWRNGGKPLSLGIWESN